MEKAKEKTKEIPTNLLVAGILVIALLVIVAVAVTWKAPAAPPTGPTAPVTACNNDGTCGAGETKENCPNDCVPTGALEAARTVDSPQSDTTPTITVKMSNAGGVQSCGSGATDSTKWECVVKSPGATLTDVDCTLKNYFYDGTYMLALRCKDNAGADIPMQVIDNIYVCADKQSGCARWAE
jgi:hypothetical protein